MQNYILLLLIFAISIVRNSCVPSVRVFEQKSQPSQKTPVEGCKCVGYNCGCCQHLEVDEIHLNDTVCINVTYLDKDYGLEVTLSVDGHVYINASVSARNPPPLCAAIPGLKDLASVCLQFYNLSVSSTSFSGCLRVVAKLKYVTVDKIDIGCFKIPPSAGNRWDSQHPRRPVFLDKTGGLKTWDNWSAMRKYFEINRNQLKQI
ncbi:uncharacterized protein LOC133188621 [Saccostrea echinata]|uniref:uncharacterized protein LOC133188621 n=1 Tax=Saccostrea echinata TaxID=191078 RepID=UPI002A7F54E3|nr:uncharacterized protein LOC133188621 [Saccostrea echinata]